MKVDGTQAIIEKQFAKAIEKGDLKSVEFLFRLAGLVAPAPGKGEGAESSDRGAPEPLTEAQTEILTFYKRDLLQAAGVDPAKIEAMLAVDSGEHDPPAGNVVAFKAIPSQRTRSGGGVR